MKGALVIAAILLLGCNELSELSDPPATCASTGDCGDGLACIEGSCVKPPHVDDPDPVAERAADDLGKLDVERDMLESKVESASEALRDAKETLAEATNPADKKVASRKVAEATAAYDQAKDALKRFEAARAQ